MDKLKQTQLQTRQLRLLPQPSKNAKNGQRRNMVPVVIMAQVDMVAQVAVAQVAVAKVAVAVAQVAAVEAEAVVEAEEEAEAHLVLDASQLERIGKDT